MALTLPGLAALVGGELRGDAGSASVTHAAPLDAAAPGAVVFIAEPRHAIRLTDCPAAVALVPRFGLFGAMKSPLTATRLFGIALMLAGTYFARRVT